MSDELKPGFFFVVLWRSTTFPHQHQSLPDFYFSPYFFVPFALVCSRSALSSARWKLAREMRLCRGSHTCEKMPSPGQLELRRARGNDMF